MRIRMLWGHRDPEERDTEERGRSARGGGGCRTLPRSQTTHTRAPCAGSTQEAADWGARDEGGQGDQLHPRSTFP